MMPYAPCAVPADAPCVPRPNGSPGHVVSMSGRANGNMIRRRTPPVGVIGDAVVKVMVRRAPGPLTIGFHVFFMHIPFPGRPDSLQDGRLPPTV